MKKKKNKTNTKQKPQVTPLKTKLLDCFEVDKLIQRFLAVWCAINTYMLHINPLKFDDMKYAFNIDVVKYVIMVLIGFAALSLLDYVFPKQMLDTWGMTLTFAIFASYLLVLHRDFWFCLSLVIIAAIMLVYLLKDDKLGFSRLKIGNKVTVAVAAGLALILFSVIALITCLRYATYSSPNFDFGLFVNMFHHMRETGLPITSSERDKLLSHFAVHISPIYYLLLPLYFIFPSPHTLQIGQALVLAGGVIPLYLLAKQRGLSNKMIIMVIAAYSFSPVIICGTSYDLHENCFLVPLLLWVFYFFEREKYLFMYLSIVLVFCIKEDASLFVFFFGLFVFFSRRKRVHGALICASALLYFVTAVMILTYFGNGILSSHYQNYMYEDHGLIGMVRIILTNPAYVFTQTLKPEKVPFLMYVLMPLGFLPLATRKVSHFILILPFMLFNLMTNYVYQYSIDFQYTYGAISCLIYLAVINSSELKDRTRRYMMSLAVVASVMCFLTTAVPKLGSYVTRYSKGQHEFEVIASALETLPEEASVKSSTFFIPHIAQRDEVYEIKSKNETDYVVFDMRPALIDETTELREEYLSKGYIRYTDEPGYVLILKNPNI